MHNSNTVMYRVVDRLAHFFAILGGLVLSGLILLTCLSIAGRLLNSALHSDTIQSFMPRIADAVLATHIGPINGDFELVEAGVAFTIFAFLPLCQLQGAHASVDIFIARVPMRIRQILRAIIEVCLCATFVLIAWQLYQGMLSKRNAGETTFLIEFPVWWAYGACLLGAFVNVLVGLYVAVMRLAEVATGKQILPPDIGAEH